MYTLNLLCLQTLRLDINLDDILYLKNTRVMAKDKLIQEFKYKTKKCILSYANNRTYVWTGFLRFIRNDGIRT